MNYFHCGCRTSVEEQAIQDKIVQELAAVGAKSSQEELSATEHKKQLMEIKKAAGNQLLLSAYLLNDYNLWCMRVLLLVWASCVVLIIPYLLILVGVG